MKIRLVAALVGALAVASSGVVMANAVPSAPGAPAAASSSVPRADCGPGSSPETGLQGQVPRADRESGRSQEGYSCNLELVGSYQGEGASWVNPTYDNCAYHATAFGGIPFKDSQGVQVIDVSDPGSPVLAGNLTSPSMFVGPWESLKVNEERGLLAAVAVGPLIGALGFDIYDIGEDCTEPRLLNSLGGTDLTLPASTLNHEGAFSPDGLTYWSSSFVGGALTAIDVSDPTAPRIIGVGALGLPNHGFSLSEDGNRMYLSRAFPAGMTVLDVSDFQSRKPLPLLREVGHVSWGGVLGASQHTIPISYDGVPHLVAADEFANEGIRIIDISDETAPTVVRHLQLEIQQPENTLLGAADVLGNGLFGYESHYCSVDRPADPTALACGFFHSGVRVFDIADRDEPREIAYFNPPAQTGRNAELPGSEHTNGTQLVEPSELTDILAPGPLRPLDELLNSLPTNLTADWCTSPPRFVGPDQLWVTCQDNGFLALRFTNDAYRAP